MGPPAGKGADHLLFQGLDPVLLVLLLQGAHPLVKQVTGKQLQRDTSEEVLEDDVGTVQPTRVG